jgi:MscS family membrane protein
MILASKERLARFVSILAFLLMLPCFSADAQPASNSGAVPPKPQDPLNRDSPQSSVFAFLEACHARNYNRAYRYLDLQKLPADQRLKNGPGLAQQLAEVLDRDAQFDVGSLSRDPAGDRGDGLAADREVIDSFRVNGQTLPLQMERVTLHSGDSVWLFSSDSVEQIPRLAAMSSDSPIEKYLPAPLVNWKLIDTPFWKWIALVALALTLLVLSRWFSRIILLLAETTFERLAPGLNRTLLEGFVGPLRFVVSAILFRAGMEWVGPSALLRLALGRALTLLFFLGLAWLASVLIDLVLRRVRGTFEAKHQTFSYSVLPLVSRVLKITVVLLTIAAVLAEWGYNTTTIVAGLGVGGLAIALAAQKTIENLFGGVAVISDRPVSVGDFCRFGDRVGTVEDIGLRSTRVRTLDRTLVAVPNSQFSSMMLENFNKRDKMLFHFTFNLRRDTTPDQVRTLRTAVTKVLTEHSKVETGTLPVRFVGVGTYSLDLEVFAYILTRNGDEFLEIQQELLLWILDEIESAGTALALPTQASFIYAVDGAHQTATQIQSSKCVREGNHQLGRSTEEGLKERASKTEANHRG